mgnify:FL=1
MDITKIWAKTAPKKSLINHMLETGIVAECLTDTNGIYYPVLNRLSEITGCDSDTLLTKIVFICAIHDIGKIHPTFQGRDEETLEVLRQENLNQMSFDTRFRHEQYGANIFDRLSVEDVDIKNSDIISQIIRMHHQKEQKKNSDIDIIKIDDKEKAKKWRHIQNEIYAYVKNIFRFDNLNLINKNISKSKLFVVQNAILGIMITSDWIASNNYVFDNQPYKNIDEFLESRKIQALKFLNNEGLIRQQIPVMQNFRSTFGFNGRPVQNDVEKIVHKNDIKCMLIESDCGSGKTEAALYAAAVLGNRSGLSGIYIGLPTSVSAEAIQDRVDEFLTSRGMRNTKLYTSKSMLLRELDKQPVWTDMSRQRLLASSAVGTVDQVMTAARLVRFESVRMDGLASKVLIIDEIHAYDAYMLAVIKDLMKICEGLGVPVIMLSATLPISTKKDLLGVLDDGDIELHNGYPVISYVTKDGRVHEHVSHQYMPDKKISCELLPILNDNDKIARYAVDAVKDGGCECVIMNTVTDAICVYDKIKNNKKNDCKIILYHSRMTINARDETSRKILAMCGKDRTKRPERVIIVGTQVLEQSIDIDVDYMITAICPIDLLFQRIGRYHRHGDAGTIRERVVVTNTVQVLIPATLSNYGETEYIYEKCYLDATIDAINEHNGHLLIPSGMPDMINYVYSHASIDVRVRQIIDEANSDAGNIKIKNGFEIYTRKNDLTDKNLNVRLSNTDETMVQIAILNDAEVETLGQSSEADIELFKCRVVTVRESKIKNFKYSYQPETGIFKDVKIYTKDNCVSEGKEIVIDDEYGMRIEKI